MNLTIEWFHKNCHDTKSMAIMPLDTRSRHHWRTFARLACGHWPPYRMYIKFTHVAFIVVVAVVVEWCSTVYLRAVRAERIVMRILRHVAVVVDVASTYASRVLSNAKPSSKWTGPVLRTHRRRSTSNRVYCVTQCVSDPNVNDGWEIL